MNEQSPNESQPKVRRAGSGAEEHRPSTPRAGRISQAEQEAPENASEKLLRAGESQVESVLQGPFRATKHALLIAGGRVEVRWPSLQSDPH
jgi:hypothetical protein